MLAVTSLVAGLLAAIAMVTPAGAATSYSDYVVFGEHGVFIGVGSEVVGLVGARENSVNPPTQMSHHALGMNGTAKITGDARIGADVNMSSSAAITGTLWREGSINAGHGSVGNDMQVADAELPTQTLAQQSQWPGGLGAGCPTGGPSLSVANNQTGTITPGSHGVISLGGAATLKFDGAGDYFVQRTAPAGNGVKFELVSPGVRLFVCEFVQAGSIDVLPTTLKPGQFTVEVAGIGVATGGNAFIAAGGTNWIGNVLVPTRGIHFGSGSGGGDTWLGYMWADHVDIEHGSVTTKPPKKSGVKFNDHNGDGVRDAGDEGLPGWTIFVDYDDDGQLDAGEPFAVTDANGLYEITDINPGTWKVREVVQEGWSCTFPLTSDQFGCYHQETFTNGGNYPDNDFGNFQIPGEGSKSGMKFNDLNGDGVKDDGESGIQNWPIDLYLSPDFVNPAASTTTGVGGNYTFGPLSPGTYRVCEGVSPLPGTWVQTFPNIDTPDPSATDVVIDTCPGPNVWGYEFTIVGGETLTDNDFGNWLRPPPVCPEDTPRAALLTRTVKPNEPLGGGGVAGNPENFHTLQAAYDAAKGSPYTKDEVIGMFMKTTENVVLEDYSAKSMTLTQCTSAQITSANGGPAWTLTSTKKLLIIGPDSVGGTIGWLIEAGTHELKSIRSNGASQYGIKILTNSNKVSFNNVASSGIGIGIYGNSNVLQSGTIGPNVTGIHIGAGKTGNQISGMTIQDNTADGVFIEGNSNTLKSNKLYRNSPNAVRVTGNTNTIQSNQADENGDGYDIAGTGNVVKDNKANKNTGVGFDLFGSGQKLTGSQSSTNALFDYRISATTAVSGPSGNKADGSSIPSASKCTGFFTNPAVLTCT